MDSTVAARLAGGSPCDLVRLDFRESGSATYFRDKIRGKDAVLIVVLVDDAEEGWPAHRWAVEHSRDALSGTPLPKRRPSA